MIHLQNAYQSLVKHMNVIFSQRLWYVVLEQFLMKYVWSGTGMVVVSLPIITSSRIAGNIVNQGRSLWIVLHMKIIMTTNHLHTFIFLYTCMHKLTQQKYSRLCKNDISYAYWSQNLKVSLQTPWEGK